MATLTITNTRPVRRNVAIASSSVDDIQPARSTSPPTAMDRQPDPRIHIPITNYLSGNCRNWDPTCGASALASDPSTLELKPRSCDKWRPECGAAANGTHLDLQESRDHWPVQRRAGQPAGHDNWSA